MAAQLRREARSRKFDTVVFSLLLLAPLFDAPGFGYDGIRLPIVLGLIALLFARIVWRLARRPERSDRSDPLLMAALFLLGANVLSLLAAHTIWESATPLLTLFAGVAVYFLARDRSREEILEVGLWVILAGGWGLALAGLAQRLFLNMPAVATEGNSNYSGTLAAMLLPPAIAFAFIGASAWKRGLSIASAVALFLLLLMSDSRGGWVGALAGSAVMGLALVLKKARRAGMLMAAALACLILLPLALRGRRLETVEVRLGIWKGAGRMFAARPWIGCGAGNFAVQHPPYRSAAEFRISNRDLWPDFKEVEDAHSSWVQAAAETGVPGVLAWLLVLYVAARLWRFYVKRAEGTDSVAALAGLGGGAAACIICGFFNTLTTHASHAVLFWAFLGFIEVVGNTRVKLRRRPATELALSVPVGAALLAAFGAYIAGMMGWMEREVFESRRMPEASERIRRLKEALDVHYPFWKAHYELGLMYSKSGRRPDSVEEYRTALRFRPGHLGALNNLAEALVMTGRGGKEAEECLRRAIEIAPYLHISHFNLGSLQLLSGRTAEARESFRRATELQEKHARSWFGLGETYLAERDAARARVFFRKARALGMDAGGALRQEHPAAVEDPEYAEFFDLIK